MWRRIALSLCSIAGIILLLCAGVSYYLANRFNARSTINEINVGGLTAQQVIDKLKTTNSGNVVYVGTNRIYDGNDTQMEFTDNDLPEVVKCLMNQKTWLPSVKATNCYIVPSHADPSRVQTLQKEFENQLVSMNKNLKAPQDAAARLEQGNIVVTPSIDGEQYDVSGLLEEYKKRVYNSEVHLDPLFVKPIKEDDPIMNQEKSMLQSLVQRTVDYKVQNQVYPFKGSDIVKSASVSSNMKIQMEFDTDTIKGKLNEINNKQSTLNKNYIFTTHSGSVISVKGESYGWALHVDEESKRIQEAFENGAASILAYNVYGVGWNVNGVGYHTTTNHGIGDTYAEVSIEEQRIWVYKNGELKVTTPVVTGTKIYNEDTPKGVWYIEYKKAPATLKGSEVGNINYSVDVSYWAPFTLDGAGFHDASWRKNWSSDAYIKEGSGGCVNTPPDVMKSVYDNLTQYEPVVIY